MTATLFWTTHVHGEVVEFENKERPLFFHAVGGPSNVTTIGFTEYPNGTTLTDHYSHLGVTFEGLNFVTSDSNSFHDGWGLRIFAIGQLGNDLYFDQPINWIAADILGSMKIELYDGDILFYTSSRLGIGGLGQFGGLISERPFDHVRIYDEADFLTVLDDLHFGPPIPTPSVLAPVCLILLHRCRRRS